MISSKYCLKGGNGGTGYYGRANRKREVDRKNYYDWSKTWNIVRRLQSKAVVFSDVGPDTRWLRNESDFANSENWSLLNREEAWPGWLLY